MMELLAQLDRWDWAGLICLVLLVLGVSAPALALVVLTGWTTWQQRRQNDTPIE